MSTTKSNKNISKTQSKEQIPTTSVIKPELIQEKDFCGTLKISEGLEKKIRFLCNKYPSNEWSGILYYRFLNGSYLKKNLELEAVDFLLNDVGSSTFTDYDITGEVGQYMVTHRLMDCKIGILHSHNTMSTFFSGTDDKTLLEQGEDTAYFLSLIVNNAGVYNAKITIKGEVKCELRYAKQVNDTNGKQYSKKWLETSKQSIVHTAPLKVLKDDLFGSQIEIENRIKAIEETKRLKREQSQVDEALSRQVFLKDYDNSTIIHPTYTPPVYTPAIKQPETNDNEGIFTVESLFASIFSMSFDFSNSGAIDSYYTSKMQRLFRELGEKNFELVFENWLACIEAILEFSEIDILEAQKLIEGLFNRWDIFKDKLNKDSKLVKIIDKCLIEAFEGYLDYEQPVVTTQQTDK